MGPSLSQLRTLAAVVEHGSFSTAAAMLGVTQPAVSAAVRQLEDTVGGQVVDRRTAQLTPLGLVVLPHARTVTTAVTRLAADVAEHHGAPHGALRLAVVATVRAALVPGLIRAWAAALPGVAVDVLEGDDGELADWLEGGLADLAVLVDPDTEDVGDHAVPLPGDAMCAALPATHPLLSARTASASIALEELVRYGLINSTGCEAQMRSLHRARDLAFRPIAEVNGLPALLAVINAGSGISIVPEYARTLLPDGVRLVSLEPVQRRRLLLTGPVSREQHPLTDLLLQATRHADVGPQRVASPARRASTPAPDGRG